METKALGAAKITQFLNREEATFCHKLVQSIVRSNESSGFIDGEAFLVRRGHSVSIDYLGRRNTALRDVISSCLGRWAQAIAAELGWEELWLWRDEVHIRLPGAERLATPWHHDISTLLFKGPQALSVWIALGDITEADAPLLTIDSSNEGSDVYSPPTRRQTSGYRAVPDFDSEIRRGTAKLRSWEMKAGDAILFDLKTVHASAANCSDSPRISMALRLIGGEPGFERNADSVVDRALEPYLNWDAIRTDRVLQKFVPEEGIGA